jgi:hypothetical protein
VRNSRTVRTSPTTSSANTTQPQNMRSGVITASSPAARPA